MHEKEIEEAVVAARNWLYSIDRERYEECWEKAAAILKRNTPQEKFVNSLSSILSIFGPAKSRDLLATEYTTTLAGVPKGEYVILRYQTSFKYKSNSIEVITPVKEQGGWKVSGYYIV